jgi:hypothetical protein
MRLLTLTPLTVFVALLRVREVVDVPLANVRGEANRFPDCVGWFRVDPSMIGDCTYVRATAGTS